MDYKSARTASVYFLHKHIHSFIRIAVTTMDEIASIIVLQKEKIMIGGDR